MKIESDDEPPRAAGRKLSMAGNGEIDSTDSTNESVDALGRVLVRFDGEPDDDALFASLSSALGDHDKANVSAPISVERAADVRRLVAGINTVLGRTKWTAKEFRVAIGCRHSSRDLYSREELSRCLAILDLLDGVTSEYASCENTVAVSRVAVTLAVEAFRGAQGDADNAFGFWSRPLRPGTPSARELVAMGDDASALLEVYAHSSRNLVAIKGPVSRGLAAAIDRASRRQPSAMPNASSF